MTPEDLFALPPGIGLRLIFEALDEKTRAAVLSKPALKAPLPPKYDQAIFRSDGIQWASETDIEGLRYWHKKSLENTNEKYAEANRKRAESLARWITWREWFPDTAWSGERDGKPGVARPPSRKPKTYPRTNGGARKPPPPAQDDIDQDADIPY